MHDASRVGRAAAPAAFREPRSAMRASPAEWYYTLLAFVALVSMPFIVGDQPQGAEALNPLDMLNSVSTKGDQTKQVILFGFYCGFTGLLLCRERLRAVLLLGAPLIALLGWTFASTIWSISPDVTLRRSIALTGTIIFGVYLGLRYDYRQLQRLICVAAVIVLTASLILAVVAPPLGLDFEGRLRGVTAHKNEIGSFSALALLVAGGQFRRGGSTRLVTILIGSVIPLASIGIVFSHSTALLPVLAAASVCLLFGRFIRHASGAEVAMLPLAGCLAVFAIAFAVTNSGAIAELLGKDSDISGRTLVWAYAETMILEKPVTGYGLGAFWTGGNSPGAVFWANTHLAVPHTHNGYLQLMLDVGIVGLALFLLAVVVLVARLIWAIRNLGQQGNVWSLGYLGFYLVANSSEAWLWVGNELLTVLFVTTVVRTNLSLRRAAGLVRARRDWRSDTVQVKYSAFRDRLEDQSA